MCKPLAGPGAPFNSENLSGRWCMWAKVVRTGSPGLTDLEVEKSKNPSRSFQLFHDMQVHLYRPFMLEGLLVDFSWFFAVFEGGELDFRQIAGWRGEGRRLDFHGDLGDFGRERCHQFTRVAWFKDGNSDKTGSFFPFLPSVASVWEHLVGSTTISTFIFFIESEAEEKVSKFWNGSCQDSCMAHSWHSSLEGTITLTSPWHHLNPLLSHPSLRLSDGLQNGTKAPQGSGEMSGRWIATWPSHRGWLEISRRRCRWQQVFQQRRPVANGRVSLGVRVKVPVIKVQSM